MNAYMQKVDAVARKVVAWRKIGKNKDSHQGSLLSQVAWVMYEQEIPEDAAPRTKNFQSLAVGAVREIELHEDSDDPKLPL